MNRTISWDSEWERTLATLYSSVVDEQRYIEFLDQLMELLNARFMVLGMFDPHDPARHAHRFNAPSSIGSDAALQFLALAAQSHADGSRTMLAAEPQQVLLDFDVYPDHEALMERPTLSFLRQHYGAVHIGTVNAQLNRAWVDYLMFAHDEAGFSQPDAIRQQVSYFVPHISVASEVRRAFALLESRYQAIFAALNHLRYGIALVLDNCEILLANSAFEAILEASDGLKRSADNTLKAVLPEAQTALQQALGEVLSSTASASRDHKTLAIERRNGADAYVLDLVPFNDTVQGELNLEFRGAFIFALDPQAASFLNEQGVAKAFGLTAAEGGVCRQVIDGFSNQQIAEVNATSIPTVKTQVSAIFAKTRVTDRAGLIRLASKVSPPLFDPN